MGKTAEVDKGIADWNIMDMVNKLKGGNMADREIGSEKLIRALDSVTWYNGLAEIIVHWKDENYFNTDYSNLSWNWEKFRSYDMETQNQLEIIWIICVELFGNYGTSPRSGWIEDTEGFYRFIDDITKTYREE